MSRRLEANITKRHEVITTLSRGCHHEKPPPTVNAVTEVHSECSEMTVENIKLMAMVRFILRSDQSFALWIRSGFRQRTA